MSRTVLAGVLALGLMACSRAPAKEAENNENRDIENRDTKQLVTSSAAALRTMQVLIHFANDQADLTDSARAILDDKLAIFQANPALRIVIVGYASQPGTVAHNLALGTRRAEAAKSYLVARGIAPTRIEIATRGKGELLVEGPGEAADAQNRRDQFQLLIANHDEVYLGSPKQ
jgi:outer membrane protein OmpA-like peptidoglycan-associated protein